jgi:glycosyltransferase involved in cell wall biosynthesis
MKPPAISNKRNHEFIIIATCTYHRSRYLKLLLDSIAQQKFKLSITPRLELLVVDNADDEDSKNVCSIFHNLNPSLPLYYTVEIQQGISFARNAILANVPNECNYLAMVDDDEVLDEYWLDNLLATQHTTKATVVRGPIVPVYSNMAPDWVKSKEYFGWPTSKKVMREGMEMESAATNNVLIDWQAVKNLNLKFDPALALTGGEDVVFFQRIQSAGHKIVYSANAKVYESIPESRTTLKALMRLNFRYGINRLTKNYLRRNYKSKITGLIKLIPSQLIKATKHIIIGITRLLGKLLIGQFKIASIGPELLRISRGVGMLVGCFGFTFKYYR